MREPPRVSVIIPTHNRRERILAALRALTRQDYPSASLELIVVTDRCTDGTREAIEREFGGRARVVETPRPGQAAALNVGIAEASGEFCIFLDDEMLPDPSFVQAHVSSHLAHVDDRIAVTGYSPVVTDHAATPLERYFAQKFETFHRHLAAPDRRSAPTDMNGGNFSIPTRALREVGGFNERYFFQRNDFELAARLLERGFRFLFRREARADQRVALTAATLVARAEPRAVNDIRLARRFPWCVPSLPFGIIATDPGIRRRWRALWMTSPIPALALEQLRRIGITSVRMTGWEYTARYVQVLRRELHRWEDLIALFRAATPARGTIQPPGSTNRTDRPNRDNDAFAGVRLS